MEETSRTLSKAPVYELLKGNKPVNLTQNAPTVCIQLLETLGKDIRMKCVESAKREGRVILKPRDVQKAVESVDVAFSTNDNARLAFAQVHRFFEGVDEIKVSEEAVNFFRNFLEALIKGIGDIAAKIMESQGKKTIDENSIKRAFLTFSKTNKISYVDFVSQLFSAEEIQSICAMEKLSKSASKQDLAKNLFTQGVSLERMLAPFSFKDIQARMLKHSFPVPLNFQHVFAWVEPAPIGVSQSPSPQGPGAQACIKENPNVVAVEVSSKEEIQEEQEILEKEVDYKTFLDNRSRLMLRPIIAHLIPSYRLVNVGEDNDVQIDLSLGKDVAIDKLLKTGISIIDILNELTLKDLKGFLKLFGVRITGSKKELIQRLLNSVDFADYDVTHQDLILLVQGKEFLKKQEETKKQDEILHSKIRNYSGSIKLDVLKILEGMGFKCLEKDIKEKYVQSGREAVSFFGVMGALLRDGIVQVKPFEEETYYEVPESIQPVVKSTLEEITSMTKELEGVVSELPKSALILLNCVCGFGEAVDLLKVKEKFFQVYSSNQTWNKARQLLKARNLVQEKFDETLEQNVIYSPKLICPILSGILGMKKKDILQAEQEQYKEETRKPEKKLDFSTYSEGAKTLLYMIVNSNGTVGKSNLKTAFTSPPGIVYSENSFFRFVKILKDDKVITEEKDPDSGDTNFTIAYKDLEQLRAELEEGLFEDKDLGEGLENLPESILGMVKILIDNGGTMLLKELRQEYLKFYSSTTFYKGFHVLNENLLSEGISNTGDYVVVVPAIYLTNIEQYFRTHPFTMKGQLQKTLSPEDFILNAYNPTKLINIAQTYRVKEDQEHISIVKELLYDKDVPFIPLAVEVVSKPDLVQFCAKNQLATSGSRTDLLKRIIDNGVLPIPEGMQVEGDLKKVEKIPGKEKVAETIVLDKDIIFEAIAKVWGRQELVDLARQLNVKVSGNKQSLIEEIFFESDLSYEESIRKLVTTDVLGAIKDQVGNVKLALNDIVQQVKGGLPGFPSENQHVNIAQLLDFLSKTELVAISQTLGGRLSGTKEIFCNEISGKISTAPADSINLIVRKVPDWPSRIATNLNVKIIQSSPIPSILALTGLQPAIKPRKKSAKPAKKRSAELGKAKSLPTSEEQTEVVETPNYSFDDLVAILEENFSVADYEAGLEDLSIDSIQKLVPSSMGQFLGALGKGFLKTLIQCADLPLDVKVDTTLLIKRILEAFNIASIEKDRETNEGLVKKVSNLKLGKREKIPNGLTFFAQGNLNKAFDTIKSEDNSLGVALSKEFAPRDLESPNLRGIFFEASVYQALNSLIAEEAGHGIKIVNPNADFDNFQNKEEEPDGILKVRFLVENALQDYYCIYDCKAYRNPYHPVEQLLKLINYIKLEDTNSKKMDEGKTWKFIILFAYSFAIQDKVVIEKLHREQGDYKIILWEARALRELWRANLYSQGKIKRQLNWEEIFRPQNDILRVGEDLMKRLIEDANKKIQKKSIS